MSKISAVIIDDEAPARENLRMMLGSFCPEVDVIGTAGSISEAFEVITRLQPDVIFLDIRMPSGSEGFDLLEMFDHKTFQVIFVTAFKEYAIEAFKANAIHYLLKPIDIEDLQNAVKQLVETNDSWEKDKSLVKENTEKLNALSRQLGSQSGRLRINHMKGIKLFDTKNIVFLEAKGNCTEIRFLDGTRYLDTRTLKVYEDLLEESFYRIHKSHIINMSHLKEYVSDQGHFAVMKTGERLPISKLRLKEFLEDLRSI
ncbi:MAG: response regulator transcription factor [Flavobacteriales bacterium]|nr:response regulator transcription factor [Flavobacteriales bacterium]